MSYAIVFSSKTGNTKLLADALHACLPQENCCYFGTPDPAAMKADDLYVGFWTDKGNADESTLDFLKQLHGKNIFLFGTAGFGAEKTVDVDFFDLKLEKGCTILMCSDGLSNMVEDEKIQEIISDPEADIDQKGSALLREANQNGGKDNIAVVLVEPFTNEVEAC